MTPAERTAKIAELRAEADRLEREGALPALALEWCDEIWRNCPRGISIAESVKWVIEQDRARITIKMPVEEPTGVELVGKVCEFSDDGKTWVGEWLVRYYNPDAGYPYNWTHDRPYRYARLYREDRP